MDKFKLPENEQVSTGSISGSRKVYIKLQGSDLKVPMRQIDQSNDNAPSRIRYQRALY